MQDDKSTKSKTKDQEDDNDVMIKGYGMKLNDTSKMTLRIWTLIFKKKG